VRPLSGNPIPFLNEIYVIFIECKVQGGCHKKYKEYIPIGKPCIRCSPFSSSSMRANVTCFLSQMRGWIAFNIGRWQAPQRTGKYLLQKEFTTFGWRATKKRWYRIALPLPSTVFFLASEKWKGHRKLNLKPILLQYWNIDSLISKYFSMLFFTRTLMLNCC